MERRRDEEGAVSLGRGSACLPLDLLLRRQAGNDLGLKDGKPRRLDAGSDRDQLGQKGQVAETRGTKTTVEAGIGAAGTVTLGMLAFGEPADTVRVLCLALIVAGTIGLRLAAN